METDRVVERVGNEETDGVANEVHIECLNVSPNCDIVNEINTNTVNKGDITWRVSEKVVTEGMDRVLKKENCGEFGELGVIYEAEIERPKNIVSDSIGLRTSNYDIVNDVNTYNASVDGKTREKVMTKNVIEFGGMGVSNDGNGIEFKKLGSDIAISGSEYDLDANIDTTAGKEEKTETVVRKKVLMKRQKKVEKKICSEGSGKEEVYNEAKTASPNPSSRASISTETDRDTCGLAAVECSNINTCATGENKVRVVKKVVKLVRKKVVKKRPEKEKKENTDEDLMNVTSLNNAEVQNFNRIEFSNPNSDIANTCASNLLGVQNHGPTVVDDTMKIEKGSPFYDASEDVNDNANPVAIKEEKILSVVREKVEIEGLEMMKKDDTNEILENMKVDNEFKNPVSDLSQVETVDSDYGVSMETQKVRFDNTVSDTLRVENVKTNVDKVEKKLRSLRKKVMTEEQKRVKKEQPIEELRETDVNSITETDVISSNLRNTGAIDQLNYENNENRGEEILLPSVEMGSDINPGDIMEVEKVDSEGSERIEGSKHEVESCGASGVIKDATMADDMVLNEEMAALERRKRRKTEIFVGGLDKNALEEDVRNAFQEIGEVAEVTVKMHEKTGNNKGFAFVRYASAADAKKAVEKLDKIKEIDDEGA